MIKRLESGEFDESIKEFALEEAEKRKKSTEFIHTNAFRVDFAALKDYLGEHEYFSTDGVYYVESTEEQIFADKAIKIFETVDNNVDNHKEDENATFPTVNMTYEGVGMGVMIGQGSVFKFWLETDE